jgi:Leucine-rich repeat (LRR) protein
LLIDNILFWQIQHLDLSNNLFTIFPYELSKQETLEHLDLSGNAITKIPSNALSGMLSLRHLSLAKNNISNWADISPNFFLQPAAHLFELDLSKNHFTSLSSANDEYVLLSSSLRFLDLSGCRISKISGQQVIQGRHKK